MNDTAKQVILVCETADLDSLPKMSANSYVPLEEKERSQVPSRGPGTVTCALHVSFYFVIAMSVLS